MSNQAQGSFINHHYMFSDQLTHIIQNSILIIKFQLQLAVNSMIGLPLQQPKYDKYTPINRNQQQITMDTTKEENFINSLSEIAQQILISLQSDKDQYQTKINNRQKQYINKIEKQQKTIADLTNRNEQLSSENNQWRLRLDQSFRHLKRSQMQIRLLNNKVKLVSHQLTQKEAVIKYLQNKNKDISNCHSAKIVNNSLNNINVSLDESLSQFRSKDLSFAKLKETQQTTDFKNKTKRIKTESSYDLKQNNNQDNIHYKNKTALNDLLNHKLCKQTYHKTLAKRTRHNSTNLWKCQDSKQNFQMSNEPKSTIFKYSAYMYGRSDHTFINPKYIFN